MRKLVQGIVDFRERMLPQYAMRFRDLARAQSPDALFITCSDSRVVPDLLVRRSPHNQPSQLNVLVQIEHLMSYPGVRNRAETGALHVTGWWFEIATGAMRCYDPEKHAFEVIDRELADRMIAHVGGL